MSPQNFRTAVKFNGLSTFPNMLGQTQPGALQQADNVCLDRPGVITPREGRSVYTTAPGGGNQICTRQFQVEQAIYGFFTATGLPAASGQLARLDAGTTSNLIPQTLVPPPGNAIHSFQENQATYLTTDDGIWKLMALYSGPTTPGALVPAGMPYALDGQGALTAPPSGTQGFLQGGYTTGYQVVFGNTDANGIETLGAPSPTWTVSNPALNIAGIAVNGSTTIMYAPLYNVLTVNLGYTPSVTAAYSFVWAVQGTTVMPASLSLTADNPVAVLTLLPNQAVQYLGPSGTVLALVVVADITAVSGTTLTAGAGLNTSGFNVNQVIYAPLNTSNPTSLAGATALSTIATIPTSSTLTVATGTWNTGPVGVIMTASVATAQVNIVEIDYTTGAAGSPIAVGDQLALTGVSGLATVSAVTSGTSGGHGFSTCTLTAFPTGLFAYDNYSPSSATAPVVYRPANVTSTFVLPHAVNDYFNTNPNVVVFWQLYRSATQIPLTAGAVAQPDANMAQVGQGVITAASYAASNIVTFVDVAPDATLGTALYTSPNQGGAGVAQYQPPVASDTCLYQSCGMYANVFLPAGYSTQLLAVGPAVSISTTATWNAGSKLIFVTSGLGSIAIGQTVTGTGIPANSVVTFISYPDVFISQTLLTTQASPIAVQFTTPTVLQPGDTVTVNGTTFTGVNSAPNAIQFIIGTVATYGSVSAAINATVANLSRAVNAANIAPVAAGLATEQVTLLSTSAAASMAGNFIIQTSRGLGTFTLTSSRPGAFTQLPASAVTPSNQGNLLYYSPPDQPEAVPLNNNVAVGTANYVIQRIIPLPGSLIIFKADGVYQLTGTTASQFSVSVLNTTAQLLANESVVALQSSVFAFTTKGVVSITGSGPQIASMAINTDLLALTALPAFASTTFAVADETKNRYMLWTPTLAADTTPTQAWIYNVLTNAWTKWQVSAVCGLVNVATDSLFVGSVAPSPITNAPGVYQFSTPNQKPIFNFGDEFVSGVVTVSGGAAHMTLASGLPARIVAAFPCPGSSLQLGVYPNVTPVVYPTAMTATSTILTMAFTPSQLAQITSGQTGTLVQSYPTAWTPIPIIGEEVGGVKQFQEFTLTYLGTTNPFLAATVQTDFAASSRALPLVPIQQTSSAFGFGLGTYGGDVYGGSVFGGAPPQNVTFPSSARQLIPTPANRGHAWWPTVTAQVAANYFAVEGLTLNWLPLQTTRTR